MLKIVKNPLTKNKPDCRLITRKKTSEQNQVGLKHKEGVSAKGRRSFHGPGISFLFTHEAANDL